MRGMIRLRLAAFLVVAATVAAEPARVVKVLPPEEGIYHCAYPDFTDSEDNVTSEAVAGFEALAGKDVTWVYFSNNWFNGIKFPKKAVRTVWSYGRVPFVRMMAWSDYHSGEPDPVYKMQRIIAGEFDQELRRWAVAARKTGIPLMIEFGTEVNGDWFPWNGRWNGGGTKDKYGDPKLADGPERFRDAYRHIIQIFRQNNVRNVTWVFHVDDESWPRTSWNAMAAYYPGDDYIDWIGISVYGALVPGEEWTEFKDSFDAAYAEFTAISASKPLALLEYGVVEDPEIGDKAAWIRKALDSIRANRYPRIKAVSYWNEAWENDDGSISDLRIDSSTAVLNAYRSRVADPVFVTEPRFSEE